MQTASNYVQVVHLNRSILNWPFSSRIPVSSHMMLITENKGPFTYTHLMNEFGTLEYIYIYLCHVFWFFIMLNLPYVSSLKLHLHNVHHHRIAGMLSPFYLHAMKYLIHIQVIIITISLQVHMFHHFFMVDRWRGHRSIAGWFIRNKFQSKMDDDLGVPPWLWNPHL